MSNWKIMAGISLAALSGCSWVPRPISEYKIDIQQGNVLTQDMVAQLRPGLSRDQVRFILGTPVLTDMFHAERWDYIYRLKKGRTGEIETRKFAVFFDDGDKLARVEGDVSALPSAETPGELGRRMRELDLGSIEEKTSSTD
jgi:outer membrane protein assembly factor BamE